MQKNNIKPFCFRKRSYALLFLFFLGCFAFSQNNINGVVSDETGMPLPGVSVLEKGTSNGVVSDFDGNFNLTVGDNATITFSFLGYKTQDVVVGDQEVLTITLKENLESLDEIVVIGYGTQKRSDVNSSVASVKSEDLEDLKQVSVDQMLQGKVAGVTITNSSGKPGSAASVRIRGVTSISGTNEPLYIIDGIPISGDATYKATSGRPIVGTDFSSQGNNAVSPLTMINPNDIESVDVLKDAAATAIYGSRGANGVIIITTKSGKKGVGKLSYEVYTGFQEVPKRLETMNLRQYAILQNALADEYGMEPRPEFAQPGILGDGTDWQDEVFRSALIQKHQLAFSGGKEGISYYLSGGYTDQKGTVLGSGFKRYSARLNIDSQVKPWLKAGANLSGSITNEDVIVNSNYNGVISNTLLQAPDLPVRNPDGSFAGPPADQAVNYYNPVALALSKTNDLIRKNFYGNIFAEAKIVDGLKYRMEIGANTEFSENNEFTPQYKWGENENVSADLNKRRQNWYSTNFKNLLTYDKTFGKHHVTVLLGNEINDTHWEGIITYATGFLSNSIQTISVSDPDQSSVTDYQGSQALLSFFGRAIYDFDNRYSLSASYRADGSSKFDPAAEGKQWGYFPSIGVSWKLSNEAFMEGTKKYIDNIKLRFGYGETGNQQIPNGRYSSNLAAFDGGLGTGFLVSNIPNPDLTWESLVQKNYGIEFTLFNSSLSVNFDYFDKLSKDFLFQVPLPDYITGGFGYEGGVESPYKNLGSMKNTGYDISLNYKYSKGKDFSWNSTLNFSRYKNEVTSMPRGLKLIQDINTNGYINMVVTNSQMGQPVGMFYGYISNGLFRDLDELNNAPQQFEQGVGQAPGETYLGDVRYVDVNGDGVVDEGDRTFIGNPHPDFTYGFSNTFKYKNIDLSIFVQGSYGNDILNLTKRSGTTNSLLYQNQLAEAIDFWSPNNPTASYPRPVSGENTNTFISDRYIEDGSYLRIQNVTLGYNLPNDLISRINISKLRIYASGQNLFTFTDYSGYDPEVGSTNQNILLSGIDNGRYPSSRTISLGLNVEF
ncbi:SusC/RagA family TonB-linked outer membrane protein [Corallibacter sp.]|uniref:SusC/RagA family TonB-linked outer membrane protein n=1 Tax=Corallibacter sp. TaxID=2038084 RepID=UPI003AB73FC9